MSSLNIDDDVIYVATYIDLTRDDASEAPSAPSVAPKVVPDQPNLKLLMIQLSVLLRDLNKLMFNLYQMVSFYF